MMAFLARATTVTAVWGDSEPGYLVELWAKADLSPEMVALLRNMRDGRQRFRVLILPEDTDTEVDCRPAEFLPEDHFA